jgi:hypothetical protein
MSSLPSEQHTTDVCVIGGGLAGLCAAIAAARNGARTMIVHDRPMFGGNASSEVRMWISGAHGEYNKETGLVEEIQLENLYRNPSLNYPMWDHVMWEKARFQPNLEMLLNCYITDARTEDEHIVSVDGIQLTTQTWHTIEAKQFIDCSGDSILAPLTGAPYRWGRESSAEFGEDIEPAQADHRMMGHSLLIQIQRTTEPQPFTPPKWAYKFEKPEDLQHRIKDVHPANFWWLEVGGINNTINDTEWIRDELLRLAYGVWDYIKNRAPGRDQAANWAVHWMGNLPGKRESRRYEGEHILTQQDIEAEGRFDDVVAFGGWTMDDHHPAGLLYPDRPTIHHPAPSPYGIPLRCLYSKRIANLLFAGRNISVTHAALSSTRVMGTTAVMGQAAGTAAAVGVHHGCSPKEVHDRHLQQLQATLMEDDAFLPGFDRPVDELSRIAHLAGEGEALGRLTDGLDRDRANANHAWEGELGSAIEYRWEHAVDIGGARLTFDSDLTSNNKKMPCAYPVKGTRRAVPKQLVRAFRLEAQDESGAWQTVYHETNNYQRLVRVPLGVRAQALRLVSEATWGAEQVRIFGFEAVAKHQTKMPDIPEGPTISERRAAQDPADMAGPAKVEQDAAKFGYTA